VSEFSRTISGVLEQVNLLSTSVVSVIDRLRLNNAAINQSNIDLGNLQNTFQSINNVISNLNTSAADISIKFNQVRDSLNSLNGNSLTFNENLSSINIQLTNTKDSLSQFSTAVSSASLAMENIVMRGSSV
jgi:peptidoglycan hydrolase CwlO-like protein